MEQSEENTGIAVEETIGDAAYGDGGTRQAFADAGRTLIAKVPGRPRKDHFPKEDFQIDLAAGTVTCPAGNVTHTLRTFGTRTNRLGQTYRSRVFNSTRRSVAYAPCGPSAWQLERAKAVR